MFSRQMLVIFPVALVTLTSNVFAVIITRDMTPAYVAAHKDEVSVTVAFKGVVQFTITRFVQKDRYSDAEIVIRKGGQVVFVGNLLPVFSKDKSKATFTFTVSPDYVAESEFKMSEGASGELTLISADGKKAVTAMQPGFVEDVFRLRLGDFAKSPGNSK